MDFIGGITGMNISPITDYNKQLHNSKAFEIDSESLDFENILNKQTASLQNPITVKGGVQVNNIDDVAAQTAVQSVSQDSTAGLMNSFSKSINGGLNSVNSAIKSADRAQEALAMGENISVHDVMLASEKAALSMQMTMQLRNKIMSAYSEINNIRV